MKAGLFFVALTGLVGPLRGEAAEGLAARIENVMARPEYRHSTFGVEIYSLTEKRTLYAHNQDRLFVPGSVTKLTTEGTVLHLLGPEHRFRTRIYRTGPVSNGVLDGDLVLVASGDPNLSNRVQPDDTLAFEDEDHAYGQVMEARLLPGDPLQVIRACRPGRRQGRAEDSGPGPRGHEPLSRGNEGGRNGRRHLAHRRERQRDRRRRHSRQVAGRARNRGGRPGHNVRDVRV